MKYHFSKMLSVLLALIFCLSAVGASAENAVIEAIMSTGTTQAFTMDAVDKEDLNTILEAGLSAASAINQQPWHFAVITNQDIMAKINSSGGGMGAPGAMPQGMMPPEGMTMPEGAAAPEGGDAPASSGMSSGASAPAIGGTSAKAALGDSPVAIIVYANTATASPNYNFDCGLACQNMVIAANALGYGAKIISSPTNSLNGEQHDELCTLLGVDTAYTAVAVLLIGHEDVAADAATTATTRSGLDVKVSFAE